MILVGDIGGTSCRLAVTQSGVLSRIERAATDAHLTQTLVNYISRLDGVPTAIHLAGAGVQDGNVLNLTNSKAKINFSDLRRAYPETKVLVLNDFEAAAWALSKTPMDGVSMIQGDALQDGPKAIIGVGTGLGVGLWTGQNALKTEGGHVTAYPLTDAEVPIFAALAKRWSDTATEPFHGLEAEALLSGTGLPKLYAACCDVAGIAPQYEKAEEVLSATDSSAEAKTAASCFSRHLGRITGDLFCAYWCEGGIVLMGGVLRKNPWLLNDDFFEGLSAGGRYRAARLSVPIALWDSDDIGLIGAAACPDKGESS